MSTEYAVEARGLSFTYQEGTQALRDVDFQVRDGEFVGLLASNGSGKTTLIKVLVGLLVPQRGEVRIGGRAVKSYSATELYRQVGVVLQNPSDQLFAPTVEEDVAFGPRNLGVSEPQVEERVAEALRRVEALELRRRAIHHLSFGEQKRVAMAGVLAMGPKILILDEPTAGLDPAGEVLLIRLLNQLNRDDGITIIVATHSVDMLPLCAQRLCVLKAGAVLQHGDLAEVFDRHEMLEGAGLRLPHVSRLLYEMKRYDGVPIDGLPLTLGEARKRILELIPAEALVRQLVGGER